MHSYVMQVVHLSSQWQFVGKESGGVDEDAAGGVLPLHAV